MLWLAVLLGVFGLWLAAAPAAPAAVGSRVRALETCQPTWFLNHRLQDKTAGAVIDAGTAARMDVISLCLGRGCRRCSAVAQICIQVPGLSYQSCPQKSPTKAPSNGAPYLHNAPRLAPNTRQAQASRALHLALPLRPSTPPPVTWYPSTPRSGQDCSSPMLLVEAALRLPGSIPDTHSTYASPPAPPCLSLPAHPPSS